MIQMKNEVTELHALAATFIAKYSSLKEDGTMKSVSVHHADFLGTCFGLFPVLSESGAMNSIRVEAVENNTRLVFSINQFGFFDIISHNGHDDNPETIMVYSKEYKHSSITLGCFWFSVKMLTMFLRAELNKDLQGIIPVNAAVETPELLSVLFGEDPEDITQFAKVVRLYVRQKKITVSLFQTYLSEYFHKLEIIIETTSDPHPGIDERIAQIGSPAGSYDSIVKELVNPQMDYPTFRKMQDIFPRE